MALTAAEEAELAQLEAQHGPKPAAAAPAALTPAEEKELSDLEAKHALQDRMASASKFVSGESRQYENDSALKRAGRVLDTVSGMGLLRTGVAAVPRTAKALIQQDPSQLESMHDDLALALRGQAPSTTELLEKTGVPAGSTLNEATGKRVPLIGNITPRGVLGFAGDVGSGAAATEGLKLLQAGGGALSGIAEAARTPEAYVEKGIESAGKSLYRSGLKAADIIGKKFGKGEKALSDTLLKYGVSGSANSIADQATAIADQLAREQQTILAEATSKGARVDTGKLLKPIQDSARNMAKRGENIKTVQNAASSFADDIDGIIQSGSAKPAETVVSSVTSPIVDASGNPIVSEVSKTTPAQTAFTPLQASSTKSQIYNLVGDQAYNQLAKTKTGSKLFKVAGSRLKTGVERAVEGVDPELGTRLKEVNKDLGNILTSKKVLASEAGKEIMKNSLTSIDGILLTNPTVLATKKLTDVLKGTGFRTTAGKTLAQNPYEVLNTIRAGAINGRPKTN